MSEFRCANQHLMELGKKNCDICGARLKYMDGMEEIKVRVFDNGGKTVDRYTVIIGNDVFTMSEDPSHPTTGINMYCCDISEIKQEEDAKDNELDRKDIPDDVWKAIEERVGSI